MNFNSLAQEAIKAAQAAGAIIQAAAEKPIAVEAKAGGSSYASQVVTAVDKAAEAAIIKQLEGSIKTYDLGLLAEEQSDDASRFEKDYFWCIDPLDGTLAFIEGRPDYAVSIALVSKKGEAQIGIIYDPNRDILFHAIRQEGAYRNGEKWTLQDPNSELTYVSDHPIEQSVGAEKIPTIIAQKQAELGLSETQVLSGGGLVINAMRVAENHPAFMLKFPKEKPGCGSVWDYAASACICSELGIKVHTYAGTPLHLNPKGTTFMNEGGMFYSSF